MEEPKIELWLELPISTAEAMYKRMAETGEKLDDFAVKVIAHYLAQEPAQTVCGRLPKPSMELTHAQQFELEKMRRSVGTLTLEQSNKLLLDATKVCMIKDNVIRGFFKQ